MHTRFKVAAWGRQSGKSTAALNEMLKRAWENPGTNYWFVSPTADQARKQYRRLVGMLSRCWQVLLKKNQTEMRVKLINQSTIEFKSGEVLDNLRGDTLHGAAVDEVRDQHPDLYKLVLRPMLTTTQGWCTFISTPNGEDYFFDLAERARHPANAGKWSFMHAPSTANPLFTQEEFEAAKDDMSEAEFAQEILAEFRDLTKGKAYGSYGSHNERTTSPFTSDPDQLVHKNLPIYIGLDFNMAPMSWTLIQGAVKNFYAFDMVHIPRTRTGTEEAAILLAEKLHSYRIKHVTLIGDASGKANKTSAAGETDYSILCAALDDAGITWENLTPEANPPVKDRVNCVNAHLRNAKGVTHFWLHPENCRPLRACFQRTKWKEKGVMKLDPGKENLYTHATDGVGYVLHVLNPITLFDDAFTLGIIR